ncbi:hypothetical protein [Inconstantimicrobium mannanitabidum]|uniref:Uncharacterized protein n=1 Tax=Inconstantimicrobium mannanitabidum TaxID=1604901 RepID=A0ACB5RE88_9CLOT|nr:hypothetical protein [Clostridium sp. TW13]GKX67598.1 hypothetical protein rsdtw13_28560 [Clostridium sp. TW13]
MQGVEVVTDYANNIPDWYELIQLPLCKPMVFQGKPYNDEDFMDSIGEVWNHIERFTPSVYGYQWASEAVLRF